MESKSYLIGYDLEFQKFIGSIATSIVFSNIHRLIDLNSKKGSDAPNYKRFVHLGKEGICITYGEMARFLCMNKSTVTECMRILKSNKIIGMDYVILEMIRCPFLYIEENGKPFCNPQKKDARYFCSHIAKQTECFTDAVLHGHIAYWNQRGKNPLTQSMVEISKATALTYRQIQFSIKKLFGLGLIAADSCVDGRYSLIALQMDAVEKGVGVRQNVGVNGVEGVRQNVVWGQTFCMLVSDKTEKGNGQTVDILRDREDRYRTNREEERTPPVFLQKISDDEKKKDTSKKTYKNGFFEILESTYHDFQKEYNPVDVAWVINRFNREWDERGGPPKRTSLQEFRNLMGFCLKDRGDKVEKETRENAEKEKAMELTEEEVTQLEFSKEAAKKQNQQWQDKAIKKQMEETGFQIPQRKVISEKELLAEAREKKGRAWDGFDEEERCGISREAWMSM